MAIRQVSLIVNCGYARVSVYENSDPSHRGRKARQNINIAQRLERFRSQFSTHSTYCIPDGYFTPTHKDCSSQFDRDCSRISDGFRMTGADPGGLDWLERAPSFQGTPTTTGQSSTLQQCTELQTLAGHYTS